ncbi:BMC domain-containing protein [Brevibacillus sp. NRS-1366]|uniref:BMC domain-containing protein n=1 Tax=Brevibacillus sp. NRS-1366 TaxID=3233899 RepID=UPI003D190C73
MTKALGMIETRGLATSFAVADAMVKAANVRLVNQETVDMALVTVVIEGDSSAVQIAVETGAQVAEQKGALIAFAVIPRPDIDTKRLAEIRVKNWRMSG